MSMDEIAEYQKLFAEPADAEKLTKLFWSISEFPSDYLFGKLQEVSGADFEDDYSEFLKKNNLLKVSLALFGLESPDPVEKILEEHSKAPDRLARVAELIPPPKEPFLLGIRQRFENDYPGALFKYMLAAVVILIVRSKAFLASWSRDFARIVERHPTPDLSIRNLLSFVFRGEALIVEDYSKTHRSFNACSKMFVALVDDENDRAKNLIWAKKHSRILDVLGEK